MSTNAERLQAAYTLWNDKNAGHSSTAVSSA